MRHVGTSPHRGATLPEIVASAACALVAVAIAMPVFSQADRRSGIDRSMSNLRHLGAAHVAYAADENGRHVTFADDELGAYGSSPYEAVANFETVTGAPHPPIILGWGPYSNGDCCTLWGYYLSNGDNPRVLAPISFDSGFFQYFGSFRFACARPLHRYVGGRFYDPTFYAPDDDLAWAATEPLFSEPFEFVPTPGANPPVTSYALSPAAMFHPDVMRAPDAGGWQHPFDLDHGLEGPTLAQARYPALKTLMLEHHWNQNTPADVCNPGFEGGLYDPDCEPYYFNHGIASAPATLFFDGSVRLLPNVEAFASDLRAIQQTGEGLWSRDTPFGDAGYLGEYAYDVSSLSHHVLTTGGILGRDTVESTPTRPAVSRETATPSLR
jgi:hypothetical protein